MFVFILFYSLIATAENGFLDRDFKNARGFTADELAALYVQRIDCTQRVYDPDGIALEGSAALRVVRINHRFFDINFESFVNISLLQRPNISEVTPEQQRQLFNIMTWKEGRPLKLRRRLLVDEDSGQKKVITVTNEFRILEETSPKMLIVKETLSDSNGLHYYYICQ